jgi:hypothetical protein
LKRDDWPERLAEEMRAAHARPFSFGSHDCCAFAARCVAAQTGRDFMADFPPYDTEAGAAAVLEARGGVRGIATACLGEPIAVNFAHRGDVVLMPTPAGDALGVVTSSGRHAAFPTARGLVVQPLAACELAWRVR